MRGETGKPRQCVLSTFAGSEVLSVQVLNNNGNILVSFCFYFLSFQNNVLMNYA